MRCGRWRTVVTVVRGVGDVGTQMCGAMTDARCASVAGAWRGIYSNKLLSSDIARDNPDAINEGSIQRNPEARTEHTRHSKMNTHMNTNGTQADRTLSLSLTHVHMHLDTCQ